MKLVIFGILSVFGMHIFANGFSKDDINGIWEIPEEIDGQISIVEIFVKDNKAYAYSFEYFKKEKNTFKKRELENEDGNAKKVKGKVFVKFEFDGEEWTNGKIYNPENDSVYYASASLSQDKTILNIRASIDIFGIIGRTLEWKRADETLYTPLNHNEIVIVDKLKDD